MAKGKKYNTPAKYWNKRTPKRGWSWGYYNCRIGGNARFPFKHIRRSKFFKRLDVTRLSMKKLWMREWWWWDI